MFAFGKFDIGEIPVNVKLGQTTVFWGESLLFNGAIHSVAYSQNPLDVWKAFATPGSEAKELFRPRVGLNVQAQVAQDVSVMAQYFFNWQNFSNQAFRYPESGSYLSIGDQFLWGGESQIFNATGTQRLWRGTDITPEENKGNYGLAAKWSPEWLDGTLGGYYRRTYDMQPQGMATPSVLPGVPAAACTPRGGVPLPGNLCFVNPQAGSLAQLGQFGKIGEYNVAFGSDIDIFGVSLSKNIAGVSVGAELSYRRNQPLQSEAVFVVPAAFVSAGAGLDRDQRAAGRRHAGRQGLDDARPGQRARHHQQDAGIRPGSVERRADLDDLARCDAERSRVQGPSEQRQRRLHADRPRVEELLWPRDQLHADLVPGAARRRLSTAAVVVAGYLRQLSHPRGRKQECRHLRHRHRRRHLPEIPDRPEVRRLLWRLLDLPAHGTPASAPTCVNNNGAVDLFNGIPAVISDRDFIALTFKTTF